MSAARGRSSRQLRGPLNTCEAEPDQDGDASTRQSKRIKTEADQNVPENMQLGHQHNNHGPKANAAVLSDLQRPLGQANQPRGRLVQVQGGLGGVSLQRKGLPGQIAEVRLENFMCHANFKIEFGPHVNFVSGTNGSGKSAVLQAIQFCLGISASKTGRATSQTSFIKTGQNYAKVSVVLWNTSSEDAYRKDVYGERITVERKITPAGSSNYTIYNANNKKVSQHKPDLVDILDHLNIDAGNPAAVMTQDVTRSFLCGAANVSDRNKFNIYMEATQLASIADNLAQSAAELVTMDDRLKLERQRVKALKAKEADLQKAVDTLQAMENLKLEQADLERAIASGGIAHIESGIAQIQAKLQAAPQVIAETARQVEELQHELAQEEARLDGQKAAMEAFAGNLEQLGQETLALHQNLAAAKAVRVKAEQSVKQLEKKIASLQHEQELLISTQAESRDEAAAATLSATQELTMQLQQQQEQQRHFDAELIDKQAMFSELGQQRRMASSNKQQILHDIRNMQHQLGQLHDNLKEAVAAKGNRIAAFGGMPVVRLVQLCKQNAARFHRPPIGPIGVHISLSDSRFALPVDAALGRLLDSFIVHDHHDSELLRKLAASSRLYASSFIFNFDHPLHSITPHRQPPPHMLTVFNSVDCNDSSIAKTVMNLLIDQAKCEKLVLCTNEQEAWHAAAANNVKAAFTLDGARRYMKGQSRGYVGLNAQRNFGRLNGDGHQHVVQIQNMIADLEQRLRAARAEQQHASQAKEITSQRYRDARQAVQDARARKDDLETQLDELMSQAPQASQAGPDGGDGEDTGLERDIHEKTIKICERSRQLQEARDALRTALCEEESKAAAVSAKRDEAKELEDANSRHVTEYTAVGESVEALQQQVDRCKATLESAKDKVATLEAHKARGVEELAIHTEKASRLCTREEGEAAKEALRQRLLAEIKPEEDVEDLLTVEALSKRMQRLKAKISKSENQLGGDLASMKRHLKKQQDKVRDASKRLQMVVDCHNIAYDGLQARRASLQEKAAQVEATVKNRFNHYMWRKKHTGSIKVDKENRTLQIQVTIGGADAKGGQVKDLKQLSGGERSFTTVAFTLALGVYTKCPFRAMDEFDVFMDAVNRAISLQSLLEFAVENSNFQFILLTPQDIAAVEDARVQLCKRGSRPIQIPPEFVRTVVMKPAMQKAVQVAPAP